MLVLHNEKTQRNVIPTPEQIAVDASAIIEISITHDAARPEADIEISQGQSARFKPKARTNIMVRCAKGETKLRYNVFPG